MCRDVFAWKGFLAVCAALWTLCMTACSDNDSSSSKDPEQETPADSVIDADVKLPFVGGPVMFTEVDPINIVYEDHEGGDAGWVELFNTSADTVDLSGLYLTDSKTEPFKWKFGNVKMAPNAFLLVFMSGKNYPDYVLPHDSLDMIGPGCWTWTDSQSDPPGYSYADPLPGQKKNCFKENGESRFGAVMRLGENEELGWSSIAVFVGTGSSAKDDVLDVSATNEILMQAYITKDRKVSFRLTQPDIDDWKGYEIVFTGTGDSTTVYRATLPTGTTFPDLQNIYGTRMSPEANESQEVTVKVFSYIARNRGHEPHAGFKIPQSGGRLYLVNFQDPAVGRSPVSGECRYGNCRFCRLPRNDCRENLEFRHACRWHDGLWLWRSFALWPCDTAGGAVALAGGGYASRNPAVGFLCGAFCDCLARRRECALRKRRLGAYGGVCRRDLVDG